MIKAIDRLRLLPFINTPRPLYEFGVISILVTRPLFVLDLAMARAMDQRAFHLQQLRLRALGCPPPPKWHAGRFWERKWHAQLPAPPAIRPAAAAPAVASSRGQQLRPGQRRGSRNLGVTPTATGQSSHRQSWRFLHGCDNTHALRIAETTALPSC